MARQTRDDRPEGALDVGPGELDQDAYEALAGFRFELRKFMAFSKQAAESAGLKPQQYQGLLAIKAHAGEEGMTLKELATELFIGLSTAVELVDRLEATGLVRREASRLDGRRTLLRLTVKAEQAMAGLAAIHSRELSEQVPALISLLSRIQGQQRGRT